MSETVSAADGRVEILGCRIDNLTMVETLDRIAGLIASGGRPHQHVVINVDKVVKARRDRMLRDVIEGCTLVNADGMPVVWASRLLGTPLKERVAGVDLFDALMRRSAHTGWRVFLLGAREEVVAAVRERYARECPGLVVAGHRNGYWRDDEEAQVADQVRRSRADILFVAMSSPKKELFLGRWQQHMNVPFSMGVGGSFDIAAGLTRRAPRWMQNAGLEWFYRFLQEPRRMFRRYFIDALPFFALLAREFLHRRRSQLVKVLLSVLLAAAACIVIVS
jgi:N-acetylglucosaminyldiphosphoundecaprenol N-acetyl-beta-D-mannosaminyltransferase